MTVKVAELAPLPPVLVQVRVYVYEPALARVPVLTLPEAALEPVHEPLATQLEGLAVALQVTVALLPVLIEVGETEMVTTGTASTVRTADFIFDPAVLLQERV